jgi:hypothetical protein
MPIRFIINRITVIGCKLQYGAAKTSLDDAVLHSDDLPELFHDAVQHLLVKRIGKRMS